ncbi:MAG: IS110 family transposase [Acidobacteria bacterium]|nr:IS110 family transposase [Acidobacteriota bacterium]
MKRFVGLDIHKKLVEACVIDAEGQVLLRERCNCTREGLQAFARQYLTRQDAVALEATFHTWSVVAVLKPFVGEVIVSNPLRTKAIAEAKIKTDKVDAMVLAQLLRSDFLPRVWEPDAMTQRLRRLTHRRAALVADRTMVKNRLHSVLAERLIPLPAARLFSAQGLAALRTLELDDDGRQILDSDLRLLTAIEQEIVDIDAILNRLGYSEDRVRLLMTLPGVGVAVAQTVLAALGDISRFRTADHAASYLGLVPSTRQSAERSYHGPITKHGSGHARWMLVQAAQHLASHPGPLGHFFRRLAKKKNRNVAVVAVARKLVVIVWHMLRNNETYRYAQPQPTQTKLATLRVAATGQRRTSGTAKGTPRVANYGTGRGTRKVPALAEVYHQETLPAATSLQDLPPGELRHLKAAASVRFVREIQRSRRKPKAVSQANTPLTPSPDQSTDAPSARRTRLPSLRSAAAPTLTPASGRGARKRSEGGEPPAQERNSGSPRSTRTLPTPARRTGG